MTAISLALCWLSKKQKLDKNAMKVSHVTHNWNTSFEISGYIWSRYHYLTAYTNKPDKLNMTPTSI